MKYSASWPPTIKHGVQVDGCGPTPTNEVHEISTDNVFSTEILPMSTYIEMQKIPNSDPKTLDPS